jgi:hypothetical protein
MLDIEQQIEQEDAEIGLLREWLPKIGLGSRAYIKGASQALLYVQENECLNTDIFPDPGVSGTFGVPFEAAKG